MFNGNGLLLFYRFRTRRRSAGFFLCFFYLQRIASRSERSFNRTLRRIRKAFWVPFAVFLKNLHRIGNRHSAVADQSIDAAGLAVLHTAGNGKNVAALLGGKFRRNQRAAPVGGLHHKGTLTKTRDNAVAHRKGPPGGRRFRGEFGNKRACARDPAAQIFVFAQIAVQQAAAQHADCNSFGVQRAAVRSGIDTDRAAADDNHAAVRQRAGKPSGDAHSADGGLSCPHHSQRHGLLKIRKFSGDIKHRRGRLDFLEQRRIFRIGH